MAQRSRPRHTPQVAVHEDDPRTLHRHIGARAHGDAHVGLGQRRRIVHSVAGHGHHVPLGLETLHRLHLLHGQDLGLCLVEPELAGDRLRSGAAVARDHDEAGAVRVKASDGLRRRRLDLVGHTEQTGHAAVHHHEHHGLPPRRSASALSLSADGSTPRPSSRARLPSATFLPSTVPVTPLPVTDRKSDTSARTRSLAWAPVTMAAASGCSLPLSRLAASLRISASVDPGATTALSRGLPSVSVPVLSMTRVSTRSSTSRASACLIRMPASAPRPVATMMDMGVARPSAHGHAMMSTATALTSACAMRGGGPSQAQSANVSAAARMTAGTKYAATTSASR